MNQKMFWANLVLELSKHDHQSFFAQMNHLKLCAKNTMKNIISSQIVVLHPMDGLIDIWVLEIAMYFGIDWCLKTYVWVIKWIHNTGIGWLLAPFRNFLSQTIQSSSPQNGTCRIYFKSVSRFFPTDEIDTFKIISAHRS